MVFVVQGAADLGPSRPGGWGLTHVRGSLRWGLNVRPQVGPTLPLPGQHGYITDEEADAPPETTEVAPAPDAL